MSTHDRLHALDAVRAFALLLGVVFHAGFSFLPGLPPGIWAMTDNSPSTTMAVVLFVSHIFRMSLFFFVAGFFARHAVPERGGARGFWTNRAKRILVPLVAGWVVVFPLIAAVWIWGLTMTFGGAIPAPPANLPAPPRGAFPLTHLWFLYYLLALYAAVLIGRAAVVSLDRRGSIRSAADRAVRWLVGTGAAAIVICLPATFALYFHESWIAWFGVPTPDQSLIPQVTSFIAYGTALTFGWLVHRQPAVLTAWGRQWPAHLAGALAGSAVCLWILGPSPVLTPAAPGFGKLGLAFAYSAATWCWCFAVIGAAVRFMSNANARGAIRRGRVVLDLHHAPAAGRGAAGRSRTPELALEPQVPAHHGRHADGSLRELSLHGPRHLHRPDAQRPSISEARAGAGGGV